MEASEVLQVGTSFAVPETALEEVFALSYRRLVVQLYGVVGDLGEAEDVVQEAFVRAAAAGRRFTRVENHEAWLRTVAVNLYRNRWRKSRNFGRLRTAGPAQDPPGLEEHVAVVQALRALPAPYREALALHYLADLPVAEVADLLHVAEGTVKSRLSRGREALGRLLAQEDGHV